MRLKPHYYGGPLTKAFAHPPPDHIYFLTEIILQKGVKLDSNLRNLLVNGANDRTCP